MKIYATPIKESVVSRVAIPNPGAAPVVVVSGSVVVVPAGSSTVTVSDTVVGMNNAPAAFSAVAETTRVYVPAETVVASQVAVYSPLPASAKVTRDPLKRPLTSTLEKVAPLSEELNFTLKETLVSVVKTV